mmetsp:Transcript_17833/g.55905  ORF Transcript_17833/g.55905 Transcript_17833/m.55905 type:complete len:281 (-) Transcript_17833:668-1510(-)
MARSWNCLRRWRALGTSRVRSRTSSRSRLNPSSACVWERQGEVRSWVARCLRRVEMRSWMCWGLGRANLTARRTTSWPKLGASSSTTERTASGTSEATANSSRMWSMICLRSAASRPSAGPQIRSSWAPACSRERRRLARATRSPPSAEKTRSPRTAGGRASSTTQRTRKSETTRGARGASRTRSSRASKSRSKPRRTSSVERSALARSLDVSSRSWARRSSALETAFLTTSKLNSGQSSSATAREASETSPEAKSSSRISPSRRLNSASVNLGPRIGFD